MNATIPITGIVASKRLMTYPSMGLRVPELLLLDVPEEGDRRDQQSRDVGAKRGRDDELCRRDERNRLPGMPLHVVDQLLLRGRILGVEPGVPQLLHLGIG